MFLVISITVLVALFLMFGFAVPIGNWMADQLHEWNDQQHDLERDAANPTFSTFVISLAVSTFALAVSAVEAIVKFPDKVLELFDKLDEQAKVQSRYSSYQSTGSADKYSIDIKTTPLPTRRGDQAFREIKEQLGERRLSSQSNYQFSLVAAPSSASSLKEQFERRNSNVELEGHMFQVQRRQIGHVTIASFSADWADKTFRLKLFEETEAEREKRFRGMQDIQVGREPFDQSYVIQSNDTHLLLDLLSVEAQYAMMKLGRSINLTIAGGKIMLEFIHDFHSRRDGEKIVRKLRQFSTLYQLLLKSDGGTVFSSIESQINQENACCMVCGQAIESDPVACTTCKTAHHAECWEYMGKCSTFACGSTKCS